MRSWVDSLSIVIVGNILGNEACCDKFKENSLKYIWETRFNKYRFESFKCCKDHCNNKIINITKILKSCNDINTYEYPEYIKDLGTVVMYAVTELPKTMMYAVTRSPRVFVYGVNIPQITVVYSVVTPEDCNKWNTTSTTYVGTDSVKDESKTDKK
jgi:hypothetical protein